MQRSDITAKDVGRLVLYRPLHEKDLPEIGKINSMNDTFVFVRYAGKQSGIATNPENLEWWLDPREVRRLALKEAHEIACNNAGWGCGCAADIGKLLEQEHDNASNPA